MKYSDIPKSISHFIHLRPDVFEQLEEVVQQELVNLATTVYTLSSALSSKLACISSTSSKITDISVDSLRRHIHSVVIKHDSDDDVDSSDDDVVNSDDDVVNSDDDVNNSDDDVDDSNIVVNEEVEFFAVGMRFRGNHIFRFEDKIRLEKEDDNPYDSNAIKILVHNSEAKWIHVAYVAREDAVKLRRKVKDFVNCKIVFKTRYAASARLALIIVK
jgi:hypothetical protein